MARSYSYASIADVTAHLSFVATFSATSRPNSSQVAAFIEAAANDLDSAMRQDGYITPVSSAAVASYPVLRSWNAIGAAMYAANAMPQGGDSKHAAFLERRFEAILKDIQEGDTYIPGAEKDTALSHPRYAKANANTGTAYFTTASSFVSEEFA